MTIPERQKLKLYILGTISKKDFFQEYAITLKSNTNYIVNCLESALINKDEDELQLAIILTEIQPAMIYNDHFVRYLCLLLKEKWHFQHETIVSFLQEAKSPESVNILYDTALTEFDSVTY